MKMHNKQHGFSLIEIMIALVIGAFLIGGVLKIFLNSQRTSRMQENLSRMQENGRFALEFMARDIRMAGYWDSTVSGATAVSDAISGTNGSTSPTPDAPDTITLKWRDMDDNYQLSAAVSTTVEYKIVSNTLKVKRYTGAGTGASFQPLIENIENMQIIYGVDASGSDGIPEYYVDASTVPNWSQVISARIHLLAVSPDDNLSNQPVPYIFNGTTTTPTDNKLRREFSTTVVLRNRL